MALGEPSHVGYTIHRLTERLDEGEILLRKRHMSALGFDVPEVYLACYRAALVALASRIDDACSEPWPVEDDFADTPIPAGHPLWRMTLSQVGSWKFRTFFRGN
jgi:hypothetical protein